METKEIKQLLQRYFKGESTLHEEQVLKSNFQSNNVADDLKDYSGFFNGISALADSERDEELEGEIMEFIQKNVPQEKHKNRWLWQMISGIAASIIIVLGGVLFYQNQNHSFEDTFDNPELAYAYAEETLSYISDKYNKGLDGLAHFDKLETAAAPIQKGVQPVNEYLKLIKQMSGE